MSIHHVEFPEGFEGYAWEVEAKGWLQGIVAVVDGRRYALTVYDPTRLAQDVEEELGGGEAFFEPNIVVVRSVTRMHIEAAVAALVGSGIYKGVAVERGVTAQAYITSDTPQAVYDFLVKRIGEGNVFRFNEGD